MACSVGHPSLLDLPDELIESVVLPLGTDGHSSSRFLAVARVCRRLHEIVNPMIYRSVWLRDSTAGDIFAATIANRPGLIPHVRDVQIHNHRNYEYDDDKKPPFPCPEDWEATIAQLFNLEFLAMRSDWFQSSPSCRRTLPPELRRAQEKWQDATLSWELGRPTHLQPLPKLKSCNIGYDFMPEKGCNFNTNEPIFHHPGLQSLSITNLFFQQFGDKELPAKDLTRSTVLEELILLNCDISPTGLSQVLLPPRALKRFTLKGQIPFSEYGYEHTKSRRDYVDALQSHAHSLEFLDLDLYYTRGESVDLRPFPVLKEFAIGTSELVGDENKRDGRLGDVLPSSLQRLILRDRLGIFPLAAIRDKVVRGELPHLKHVSCHFSPFEDEDEDDEVSSDEEESDDEDDIYDPDFPTGKKREKNMALFANAFKELGVDLSIDHVQDPIRPYQDASCACWVYKYRV
ncbi:uncharacterized protein N7459_003425 [Penicillium hispanicum]|uniref:uncharacterized protein n=1 Tax=Penicillium hispanicum TaxID=1080232 RepID=UPI0025420B9F|nr:uncharacterized protein N7459_003425 [Penicillium hispanicum]KAJ5587660.1 hypothetical protein N7459_003425 [Penicillium hispanicum]